MNPLGTFTLTPVIAVLFGLLRVNTCGAEVVPTTTEPKLALAGESVGGKTATPVQVTELATLSVPATTVMLPDCGPGVVGAQVAVILQVKFAVRDVGQFVARVINGG